MRNVSASVHLNTFSSPSSIKNLRLFTKTLTMRQDLFKSEKIKGNKVKKSRLNQVYGKDQNTFAMFLFTLLETGLKLDSK